MKFPCIECGLCCRMSGQVPQLASLMDASGKCHYFDEKTHHCLIYDHRPVVCNVSKMYEQHYQSVMPEKEFYRKNLEICLALNKAAGLSDNCKILTDLIQKMS